MLFILTPVSAISFAGLQVAELLVVAFFLFELLSLKSRICWIVALLALFTYILVGGASLTGPSQIIKAGLLPLLYMTTYNKQHGKISSKYTPFIETKQNKNLVSAFFILGLLSIPFGIRLPFGTYIDSYSGLFRHSVDFAVFALLAMHYLFNFSRIPSFILAVVFLPSVIMGGSRTLLLMFPLYLLLKKTKKLLLLIIFALMMNYFFLDYLLKVLSEFSLATKMQLIIELILSGNLNSILTDSSLMVRVDNFTGIWQSMSATNLLIGMPRADIIRTAINSSGGDPSTDNIIFYKLILFGIPLGLLLVTASLISIWLLCRDYILFTLLFSYGMLQDWLSNGFSVFMIYIFFKFLLPPRYYHPAQPARKAAIERLHRAR